MHPKKFKNNNFDEFCLFLMTEYRNKDTKKKLSHKSCLDAKSRLKSALNTLNIDDDSLSIYNRDELRKIVGDSFKNSPRSYSSVLCKYADYLLEKSGNFEKYKF